MNMNSAIIEAIKHYFLSVPIDKAWLFGSFARGEEKEGSDIDLLVQFTKGVKIGLRYFHIINDLEQLSGRKIDLVEVSTLDPQVVPYVNQDRILIYERDN